MDQVPHYKRLHQYLKRGIQEEDFKMGTLLPSENELCNQYSITRATVRQALGELVREGYIEKQRGKGSVVINNRKSLGLLSFKGFSDVVSNTSLSSETINLKKPVPGSWEAPFFYELSTDERESGCIRIERLRKVEGKPVMVEYTFLPNRLLDDQDILSLAEQSLFKVLLRQYGIEVMSMMQDVRAIATPGFIAPLLDISTNSPLLHIYRKYNTSIPDYFIYSSLYCNTSEYAISNDFN